MDKEIELHARFWCNTCQMYISTGDKDFLCEVHAGTNNLIFAHHTNHLLEIQYTFLDQYATEVKREMFTKMKDLMKNRIERLEKLRNTETSKKGKYLWEERIAEVKCFIYDELQKLTELTNILEEK